MVVKVCSGYSKVWSQKELQERNADDAGYQRIQQEPENKADYEKEQNDLASSHHP